MGGEKENGNICHQNVDSCVPTGKSARRQNSTFFYEPPLLLEHTLSACAELDRNYYNDRK